MSTAINVQFKLIDTQTIIGQKIIKALREEFNIILRGMALAIRRQIGYMLETRITNHPTWKSLEGGVLKAEFGLPDDTAERLKQILEIWIKQIDVDYKPMTGTNTLRGTFTLGITEADWLQVISNDAAIVITKLGKVLPWLEWLLLYGDKIIVQEYHVIVKNSPKSRSGMAIMTNTGRWRVPPEFAGMANDNFITQILEDMIPYIEALIEKELTSRL